MNVFKSTGMIDVVANVVMSGGFLPKTTITTIRRVIYYELHYPFCEDYKWVFLLLNSIGITSSIES